MATLAVATATRVNLPGNRHSVITIDWLSTDLGVVSKEIGVLLGYASGVGLQGKLTKVLTIPGLLGIPATEPPTTLYDVTLLDVYSLDIADGTLADRSNTAAETVVFSAPIPLHGPLTLTIAAAGDAKHGRLILFLDNK